MVGVPEVDAESYPNKSHDDGNGDMKELLEKVTSSIEDSKQVNTKDQEEKF